MRILEGVAEADCPHAVVRVLVVAVLLVGVPYGSDASLPTDVETDAGRRVVADAGEDLELGLVHGTREVVECVVLAIGRAVDVWCAVARECGIEEDALMVGSGDLIVETLAEERACVDVETLVTEEVDGEIVFEDDRDLDVVGKDGEVEPLILEGALAAHGIVGWSGADKFLEGAEAHARIVDLGLDGEVLTDVPTAERAPLTHAGLEVVAIAIDGCEVKTALEAPVELCLRRSLERESAYERKRYQQFFHYCMFLFFLMVHTPSWAQALRVLYPCVFRWKAGRRVAATFQGANVCIYFCIAICGGEGH